MRHLAPLSTKWNRHRAVLAFCPHAICPLCTWTVSSLWCHHSHLSECLGKCDTFWSAASSTAIVCREIRKSRQLRIFGKESHFDWAPPTHTGVLETKRGLRPRVGRQRPRWRHSTPQLASLIHWPQFHDLVLHKYMYTHVSPTTASSTACLRLFDGFWRHFFQPKGLTRYSCLWHPISYTHTSEWTPSHTHVSYLCDSIVWCNVTQLHFKVHTKF